MTGYNVFKLLHILAAIVFVGGLIARQLIRAYARGTDDVVWFATLSKAASYVENRMVKPGSLIVPVLGVIQARLGGIPVFGILTGGNQNWLLASVALSLAVFALVPTVFLPRGRQFRPVLDAALRAGAITPELRAAMHDPVVVLAHRLEGAATLAVVALMVLKPF
jgi:uncharacterized membrane protein